MTKEEKREYDKEYRRKNKESLTLKKKMFCESESGRAMQKRQREKNKKSGYTNDYNAQPEQRKKERYRRYKRLYGEDWIDKTKHCIGCNERKFFLEFEGYSFFPDGRNYLCKECESEQQKKYGYSTRGTMTAMVMRKYTSLTREDIAKHPYLIEANKYLILLKQLTK